MAEPCLRHGVGVTHASPHLPHNDFAKSLRAFLPLVRAEHGSAMTGEES
jgi:hypothetical protein